MQFVVFKQFFSALLMLSVVVVTSCSVQDEIVVDNAWIPEAPPSVSALAGYLDLTNHFQHHLTLTGAKSAFFEEIVLHRTVVDKETDFARMVEQSTITIESGQNFKLTPGGYHLMLLNPLKTMTAETSVAITLLFDNGYQKSINFEVRPFSLQLESN